MGGKWRAHLVNVTVGLINSHYVQIKSGLQEGEQVIYDGYEALHDGDPVVPTEWGPQGPLTLPPATGEEKAVAGTVYTCPMHPEVRLNHPGNCPKCGMKLVPVKAGVPAFRRSGVQEGSSRSPSALPGEPEHLNARPTQGLPDTRPERLNARTRKRVPAERLDVGASR